MPVEFEVKDFSYIEEFLSRRVSLPASTGVLSPRRLSEVVRDASHLWETLNLEQRKVLSELSVVRKKINTVELDNKIGFAEYSAKSGLRGGALSNSYVLQSKDSMRAVHSLTEYKEDLALLFTVIDRKMSECKAVKVDVRQLEKLIADEIALNPGGGVSLPEEQAESQRY